MTLRAGLASTLWVALFATSSVRAEFGTPYITPSHPVLGETVSFNIYQGGCDGIVGADAPEVTEQGSYIYVLAQGVRYTNPELCTLTYGVATYAIGAYAIGDYAMQLDLRYPTIGGDFVTETLGVVSFSVLEGAPIQPAVEVPSLDRLGTIALTLLIILTAARRFAERTRVESNETELVLVPTDGSEPLWLARTS
jgi:hypothetical protein